MSLTISWLPKQTWEHGYPTRNISSLNCRKARLRLLHGIWLVS
jgi:hypothetical protein